MLHVYEGAPMQITESKVAVDEEEIYLFVQRRLQEEADSVNPVNKVLLETSSRKGRAKHDIIVDVAKEKGADLIIVGMKIRDQALSAFTYETADAIVRRMKIPLLAVPEMSRFVPISAIALSSEEDIEPGADLHFLEVLRTIIEHFHPRIYAVRVTKGSQQKMIEAFNWPFRLKSALGLSEMEFECVEGTDVPTTMNEFISAQGIDLFTAFPRKHSRLAHWFTRSTTRSLMLSASIPLLVLPALSD